MRCFYRWARRRGVVEVDPTEDLRDPKVPPGLPHPISETHLRVALTAATDPLLRVWLLLGAYCGLRVSEIARVRVEHVALDQTPVALRVVDGKGGRDRVVPVPSTVVAELRPFLTGRGRLWLPDRLHPGAAVTYAITGHLRSLGIAHSAHSLRHRYATALYRASRDLLLVQRLLGHSSPATTAIYAQYDEERGAAIVEQLGALIPGVDVATTDGGDQ